MRLLLLCLVLVLIATGCMSQAQRNADADMDRRVMEQNAEDSDYSDPSMPAAD